MVNKINIGKSDRKGGYNGNRIWTAHRLEGSTRGRVNNPIRKRKKD